MEKKQIEKLESVKKALAQDKAMYMAKWRELAQFLGISFSNWSSDANSEKLADTRDITDSTADEAGDLMASGIQGYACGASNAWFSLSFEDMENNKSSTLGGALKECERHIYKQFAKADFYTSSFAATLSNVHLATAIVWMEENPQRNQPSYTVLHPRDCNIMENTAHEVDVLFREFWLTQEDAVNEFGEDNLPAEIRNCKDPMQKFQFTNYVGPRSKFGMKDAVAGKKDFISVYWQNGNIRKTVKEEEYDVKPFAVWRWSRPIYGGAWGADSPGMKQLSNIKQVNGLIEDKTRLSQLQAVGYGKKTRGLKVNLVPNGFTELGPGEDFTVIRPPGDLSWTDELIKELQQKIKSAYYSDYFLILSSTIEQRKTATEANGLQEEKSVIMASFFSRMGAEFLEPVIEWTFQNEMRHGRLPWLAKFSENELVGKEIKIDFVSQLAKTQERAARHAPNQAYMSQLIQLMQVFPEARYKVDVMEYLDDVAEEYGTDDKIVVNSAKAKANAEAVAQAQMQQLQAQQQMQNLKDLGGAVKDLSGKVDDSSVISRMGGGNG